MQGVPDLEKLPRHRLTRLGGQAEVGLEVRGQGWDGVGAGQECALASRVSYGNPRKAVGMLPQPAEVGSTLLAVGPRLWAHGGPEGSWR